MASTIDPTGQAEALALLRLFQQNSTLSQAEFGARFNIGSQGMVWQYLHGKRPLNLKAAVAFANGLAVPIDAFSPRLAAEGERLKKGLDSSPNTPTMPPAASFLPGSPVEPELFDDPADASYGARRGLVRAPVIGRTMGGVPDRIWDDAGLPIGVTDEYALVSSDDPHVFLVRVEGDSMSPKYDPGGFAMVEPGVEPQLGEEVLVRLATGETMLKRLLSRRGGMVQLSSFNNNVVLTFRAEEVVWMYYVPHPVPARRIKSRL